MYFYTRDGKELGPISIEKLQRLVRAGEVKPHDPVSRSGSRATYPAWRVLGQDAPDNNPGYAEEVHRDDAWAKETASSKSTKTKAPNKTKKAVSRPPWMNRLGDPESTFEVSRSVTGAPIVQFNCPGCEVKLRANIEEVGSRDHCPDCQKEFETPGPSGDFIGKMLWAAEQNRTAVKEKGVKVAKGIGKTTIVTAITVAALATVYYLYLVVYWLTNVVSDNIELILGFSCLFLFIALVIGLLVGLAAASEGKSGVDNPFLVFLMVLIVLPMGPLAWLLLAFFLGASGKKT